VPVEGGGGGWEQTALQRAASETKGADVNSSFNRRRLRWLTVALAAAAFAAPVAQARHAPGEDPGTTSPRQSLPGAASQGDSRTQWNASPLEIDRLGPKYVPLHLPQSAAPVEASRPGPTAAGTAIANARHDAMPVSVVKLVGPRGFDWGDAGIGAGGASLTLALVAALSLLLSRRGRRTIAPEQSELAGS
jgi:hypothetical protein